MIQLTDTDKEAIIKLSPLLEEFHLDPIMFDKQEPEKTYLTAQAFAFRTLILCGLTEEMAKITVFGIRADDNNNRFDYFQGWAENYDLFTAIMAIKTYSRMVIQGDKRVELGIKYPVFNEDAFQETFNLIYEGEYFTKGDILYDVYSDKDGNIYSFEPGTLSNSEYVGMVFKDATKAFVLLNWLLYSKDSQSFDNINLIKNMLGGFDIEDTDFNNLTT